MKNKKDLEDILINKTSMDDLIKMKIEKEFMQEMLNAGHKRHKKIITDIKDVPKGAIFGKNAVFKIFNRQTKTETTINGIQAEGMLGLQDSVRTKLLNGETTTFATEDAYVKFEKLCLNS